jgi:hemolysin D
MSSPISLGGFLRSDPEHPVARREDQEFLPADLEILETPPSPVRMALILAISSLTLVAFAWAYFGHIEIVAVAQGKIQPTGRVKVIQPVEGGKVAAVFVENGAHVEAGDLLVKLDDADAEAEEIASADALSAFRAEADRRRAALVAASEGPATTSLVIEWDAAVRPAHRRREESVLRGDLAQLAATVASLDAQIRQKEIERDQLASTITAQEELIATISEQVDMREALLSGPAGSRANVLEKLEALKMQRTVLTTQKSQHAVIGANLDVLRPERARAIASFLADNGQRLAEAERQIDDIEQRHAKAATRLRRTRLISPIAGTVVGSTISTVGQVVANGEELMHIVPRDTPLEIEAYLPNKDIGFVRPGQSAVVKVDAFPFTRYGSIGAEVSRVGRDAIPQPDAQQTEATGQPGGKSTFFAGAQRTQNLLYPVTLALKTPTIAVDGELIALQSGMAVSVEVATGSRRILEYFFSPLIEVSSEAIKER